MKQVEKSNGGGSSSSEKNPGLEITRIDVFPYQTTYHLKRIEVPQIPFEQIDPLKRYSQDPFFDNR